jgi:hypothetical protein
MTWFSLLLLSGVLVALFVSWDLVFCGGRRCRELDSRTSNHFQGPGGRRPPPD